MMNMTETVKQLLIINILFFVGTFFVGQTISNDILALHSTESEKFQIWQLFTHMFMHGGFLHIFFNMFALVSFGSLLERLWGGKKFIFFYISCGLGAAALQLGITHLEIQNLIERAADLNLSGDELHTILNATISDEMYYRTDLFVKDIRPILEAGSRSGLVNEENFNALFEAAKLTQTPMVGASGAIYGVLVAFAFIAPNAELMLMFIPVPIKAKYFVPGLLLLDLYLGLKGQAIFGGGGDGVAHFAHIGGALIGFIMMWYWKKNSFNDKRWN
ncbi:rhomboid family intramembrane serine protease [Flavobacterium cyanobacteriorum]|uniref:Rhomboid family intramembrane serine protease n=1 Tax=Flavobacterium cyanobacteriorum TaxID=2022802 RepID=A0A255Z947_9FLAO|nr:rhomboid family intramembrane serine protease [Flavobacterium cyanobacteriorum]OYQ37988.1 rhomboid family intramembrane serine protease [Flavobacterium cyanobacteriorum]